MDKRTEIEEKSRAGIAVISGPALCDIPGKLRDDPAFVKELDFVMEQKGKLIGQNMFMKTVILEAFSAEPAQHALNLYSRSFLFYLYYHFPF